jgi:hypothetical protein
VGTPLEDLSDLKLTLVDEAGNPTAASIYAKVIESDAEGALLRITTQSAEAAELLSRSLRESA